MNFPEKYRFEILKKEANKEMLPELIRQLKKDFEMTGSVFELEETASPDELVQFLSHRIEELIRKDYTSYANLMYRIDVSETKISAIRTDQMDVLVGEIAQLILEKERQKVWFRLKSRS